MYDSVAFYTNLKYGKYSNRYDKIKYVNMALRASTTTYIGGISMKKFISFGLLVSTLIFTPLFTQEITYAASQKQPIDYQVSTSSSRQNVINSGMKYLGTPYEFGSSRSNTRTFDCSDFVRQAYLEGAKIKLPADSRKQGELVKTKGNFKTNWRNLKPGDIMFFMSYKGSKSSVMPGKRAESRSFRELSGTSCSVIGNLPIGMQR